MNRSLRCLEKPELTTPAESTPFRQRLHAVRALDALAASSRRYEHDLASTAECLRQGTIPADRLSGLRTHATRLQAQLAEFLSLIPAEQPAATTQKPTSQP